MPAASRPSVLARLLARRPRASGKRRWEEALRPRLYLRRLEERRVLTVLVNLGLPQLAAEAAAAPLPAIAPISPASATAAHTAESGVGVAGGVEPTTVAGLVFDDANANGLRESNEADREGVAIALYRDNGDGVFDPFNPGPDSLVETDLTDVNGQYSFAIDADGLYFLDRLPEANLEQTVPPTPPGVTPPSAATFYAFEVSGACVFPIGGEGVLIDDFSLPAPEANFVISALNPNPEVLKHQAASSSILGGERDLLIEVIPQADPFSAQGFIGGTEGIFELETSGRSTTRATLQYDGLDGDITTPPKGLVNNQGLSSIDLTANGANSLRLDFLRAQAVEPNQIQLSIRLTSADGSATLDDLLINTNAPFSLCMALADFELSGDFSFQAVTSIEVVINSNLQPAMELQLDRILTTVQTGENYNFGTRLAEVTAGIDIEKFTNGLSVNAPPGPLLAVGSQALFSYTVVNSGTLPLFAVTVNDDNGTLDTADDFFPTFTGGDTSGDSVLDVGEVWTYEASRIVTAGQYTNVAFATALAGKSQVNDSDASHHFGVVAEFGIDIEKFTHDLAGNRLDADEPTGPLLPIGSTAVFSYDVTNTGTVPLHNVAVIDDNGTPENPSDDFSPTFTGGDTNGDGLLDVDELWTYEASRTVAIGQYANVGVVTASTGASDEVSDSDASHHFGVLPQIDLEKLTRRQSDPPGSETENNAAPGPQFLVGEPLVFAYRVTNTGNEPLGNVVLTDDAGTPGSPGDDVSPVLVSKSLNQDDVLDLGETWTYELEHTVTAGLFRNVASVVGTGLFDNQPGEDVDVEHHQGVGLGIDLVKRTNGSDNNAAPGALLPVGETATFTYEVTNSGGLPIDNLVLVDDNGTPAVAGDDFSPTFTGGDTDGDERLDVGELWTYEASRIVTPGQYTNVARASGLVNDATIVEDTDVDHHFGFEGPIFAIDLEKFTNGQSVDAAPGPLLPVGSIAEFTYTVENIGTEPLFGTFVVDDNGTPGNTADDLTPQFTGGDTNGNDALDVDEVWTFAASRTVTVGQHTNVAVARAFVGDGFFTDSDVSHHLGVPVGIEVVKLTNDSDNNELPGLPLLVGSTATFTYEVTASGQLPIHNVVLVDDNGTPGNLGDDFPPAFTGGDTNDNSVLDLGETWVFTATRVVTAGQYTNIATVTGQADTVNVSDTDLDSHFGTPVHIVGINIEKLTNGESVDAEPGPLLPVGGPVQFTYTIANTGTVPLFEVTVIDDNGSPGNTADDFVPTFLGGDTNGDGTLDVGEVWMFEGGGIVTAGQYTNVAIVTASAEELGPASDSDVSHHFGVPVAIDLVKRTNGSDNNEPPGLSLFVGATATFTYQVTNAGELPIGSLSLVNDNGTPENTSDDFSPTFSGGDANANSLLDRNETWTYTASRVVTEGQYTNAATVSGRVGVVHVSDVDVDNHVGIPIAVEFGIDLEKVTNGVSSDAAPGVLLPVGSQAVFTYTLVNIGDVPLASVVLVDDNGTSENPGDDFSPTFSGGDANGNELLDVEEVWTYTASRVVTAGAYANVGRVTASAAELGQATDSDTSHHFGVASVIDVEKLVNGQDADSPPGQTVAAGSSLVFTYEVRNNGNRELSDVSLVDDNGTPENPSDDFSPTFSGGDTNENSLLDLNETWTYTASRIAPAGAYTNVAVASASSLLDDEVSDSDPANVFGATAGINLVKRANGDDANSPPGPTVPAGSTVTFRYSVTNTGNSPLSNVVVRDDNGTPSNNADDFQPNFTGGDTNANDKLDVSEVWTYTSSRTVLEGQYTNTAEATATTVLGGPVNDTDVANVFGGALGINLVKTVNGEDANSPRGPIVEVGSILLFNYTVTNTGDSPLSSVVLWDDNGTPSFPDDDFNPTPTGGDTNGNGQLDVGEIWTYTASGIAPEGQYTNVAQVSGTRDTLIVGDRPDVVFIIDISGSTAAIFQGSSIGDVNGDGVSDTILDAEIAGFLALNERLIDQGLGSSARIAVVAFDTFAQQVDLDPSTEGLQLSASPAADRDGNGVRDVEQALRSLREAGATNFEAALQVALQTFTALETSGENANIVFLSDGFPTAGGDFTDELASLQAMNANLSAYGVGTGSSLTDLQAMDPAAVQFTTTDELLNIFSGFGEGGSAPGVVVFDSDPANAFADSFTFPPITSIPTNDPVDLLDAPQFEATDRDQISTAELSPDTRPVVVQSIDQVDFLRPAGAGVVGTEARFVLRRVLPSGVEERGANEVVLEEAQLDDLPAVFRTLPDDQYRIYFVRTDNVEQLVVEVLVREGRPVESTASSPAAEQPPPAASPAPEDRSSRDERPTFDELDRAFERYAVKEDQ